LQAERYYFSNLSLRDGLSQITVSAIYQDSRGYLWFGTRNGLNRFDGYTFEKYYYSASNLNSLSDNHILCILEDDSARLWAGTNNGLNRMDLSTNKIKQYLLDEKNPNSLSNNFILSMCRDDDGNIWAGTNSGLNRYDAKNDRFERFYFDGLLESNNIYGLAFNKGNLFLGTYYQGVIIYNIKDKTVKRLNNSLKYVRSIFVDKIGNLWVGTQDKGILVYTKNGIVKIDAATGLSNNFVRTFSQSPDGKFMLAGTLNGLNIIDIQTYKIVQQYKDYEIGSGNLSHYSIQCLFFDNQNTLWIGTYSGGINYYSPYSERFRTVNLSERLNFLTGIIGQVVETPDYLYFATEGSGILEMDKKTEILRAYPIFPNDRTYSRNILKSLYLDGNRILCGTNAGTIYSFNLATKRFSLFHDFGNQNGVYYIGKNSDNKIVAGGVNQIGLAVFSNNGVKQEFPLKDGRAMTFQNIRCLSEIRKNLYLIGTRSEGIYLYDTKTLDLQHFASNHTGNKSNQLPENYITVIYKDRENNIWIGTYGSGFCLFNLENKDFTTYDSSNGLLNDNVCSILESEDGHLWINTVSGISDFDVKEKTFNNYSYSSGINIDEFTPHTGTKLSNGQIVFSGNNGFIIFNPNSLGHNPNAPAVLLENLFINNAKIEIGSKILKKTLSEQKEIILTHSQSNFSIEYTALNYIFPNKNEYAYILEGFDKKWNETGNRRIAYYTNIPSGIYTFKVKAANNDGVWNNNGAEIKIKILPPPWKTWWAYSLYFIALAGILYFIYRHFYEKAKLENEVKVQQAKAKAQQEFNAERSKLFTNFSHELRTPLTLIISPLDDLSKDAVNLTEAQVGKVAIMKDNAQRLLRLVNNLMDFRKNESGILKPDLTESDFVNFAEEMTLNFKDLAASRKIDLSFYSELKEVFMLFDRNLMEKVFFNFLSNAFKNTPDGGKISVNIYHHGDDKIRVEICDSGVGIPEIELEKIFEPFYQVSQNEHSASGTGLGLSLSKSIIEMHKGTVWAENNTGCGAAFKCILPVKNSGLNSEHLAKNVDNKTNTAKEKTRDPVKSAKKKYSVLLVEDNLDVRKYLVSQLEPTYDIIQAANGQEAMDKAGYYLPDLIISDVMMPKTDGITMAQALKNDLRTGHIPIILLTAKALPEDQTAGYNTGADDYIIKPFNTSVLQARVKNLLDGREKLKDIYGKHFSIENLGIETTSADERFMQKLYEVMEKNLSNPEFNLDEFSRQIGMSKANLYRKIKAVTNLSPNEFVRNFRLETAAKIMKNTDTPVSEVYVAVGFSSHAYFSNCFKLLYGITPSEYAKN
jgi:signal transduction histidine kinase/ligand-binding sensor domain-containing protein/DNA-binding response OmpR family regulator